MNAFLTTLCGFSLLLNHTSTLPCYILIHRLAHTVSTDLYNNPQTRWCQFDR